MSLSKIHFSVDERMLRDKHSKLINLMLKELSRNGLFFQIQFREILQVHSEKEFATVSYRVFNNQSQTVLNGTHQLINGTLKVKYSKTSLLVFILSKLFQMAKVKLIRS